MEKKPNNRPENLKDHIETILHGSTAEKNLLKGKDFYLSDTADILKNQGIIGDYFTIRYGTISRKKTKDCDHALTVEDWLKLQDAINKPFLITKHNMDFDIYTDVRVGGTGKFVKVGVFVSKNNLVVNKIRTVWGAKSTREDPIIYISEKITPEQTALIDEHNLSLYLSTQGSPVVV